MADWLVISADLARGGRGLRGSSLMWFLRTYFGRRQVGLLTPAQLRRRGQTTADTVCLAFPSTFGEEDLKRLSFRRLVLFDYLDQHELAYTPEQAAFLRPHTEIYLKPWFESAWQRDLRMGLLPIRRHGRFSWAVRVDRWIGKCRRSKPEPLHDVAFVGRPNCTRLYQDGQIRESEQRLEWVRDVRRQAKDLDFWGGLVAVDAATRQDLREKHVDIDDLICSQRKVNYPAMYYHMRRSRVVLAPGGNVPWTYRHYEALYCGAVVVTIDYRNRDMLVPLPRDRMIHVPDGDSVLPFVRQAIEWSHERPTLGRENIEHLEQYLADGDYSRRRPALVERFLRQLD